MAIGCWLQLLLLVAMVISVKSQTEDEEEDEEDEDMRQALAPLAVDCLFLFTHSYGHQGNGVYTIYLRTENNMDVPVQVFCDALTEGGGWTLIQRRVNGMEDFSKTWWNYTDGFGQLYGEFWLGNSHIYALTKQKRQRLRIDMTDSTGKKIYAEYDNFAIGSVDDKYKLVSLGSYSGDAGDALSWHVGRPFSTVDRDNDAYKGGSCAQDYKAGWWYSACYWSNLNGLYLKNGTTRGAAKSIDWFNPENPQQSLKFVEMKVKPFVV